jgi:formyl-CoA transferase
MTRTPEPEKLRPTPGLGEHTDDILHGLGYSDAKIADLRASGVI